MCQNCTGTYVNCRNLAECYIEDIFLAHSYLFLSYFYLPYIANRSVGSFAFNNTCVGCPLGYYAASQNGGSASQTLACQVNKRPFNY